MGWFYFILLVVWVMWVICTNFGKIMTFLMLAVCGIIAACFGLLAFEWIVIGLARAFTFAENHGWLILSGIIGTAAAVFMMIRMQNVPVVYYTASNHHDDQ